MRYEHIAKTKIIPQHIIEPSKQTGYITYRNKIRNIDNLGRYGKFNYDILLVNGQHRTVSN